MQIVKARFMIVTCILLYEVTVKVFNRNAITCSTQWVKICYCVIAGLLAPYIRILTVAIPSD
jgi:hypothetical protein